PPLPRARCLPSPGALWSRSRSREGQGMSLVDVESVGEDIRIVRLDRPGRLNALSIDLAVELDEVRAAVGRENLVRIVILTGTGRAFCSGLDLKDYGIIPNID